MADSISKNGPKFYAKIGIMLAIMFFFRLISPPEGLTSDGLAVVGVFFAILYGWLFIDMVWPSFIGLIALGLTLNQPMDTVLGSAFGNSTVLLILFFCMVAGIINAAGIAEYVARRIICVPIINGRPYVLLFMLCLAMCALATMLTMTSAILVAMPLVKEICKQYGYKPGDTFPMLIMMAMLYAGELAYMMLPFKSLPALVFGIYSRMSGGVDINLAAYVVVVGIILLISIGFVICLYKFILRPDVAPILNSVECMEFHEELSTYQKTILWSFAGLIVLLLLPNVTPKSWALTKFLRAVGYNGTLLAYVGFYLMFSFKEGIPLKDIMQKSMAWPAIFLIAAVLEITGAFDSTGVTKWLGDVCQPLLAGVSGQILIIFTIAAAVICTQLANNNACAVTFAPIAYTLAIANGGVDPQAIFTCLILSCTLGLATPASGVPAAILYGDTEWVHQRTVIKYATLFWVFNIVLLSTVGYHLCRILF